MQPRSWLYHLRLRRRLRDVPLRQRGYRNHRRGAQSDGICRRHRLAWRREQRIADGASECQDAKPDGKENWCAFILVMQAIIAYESWMMWG